MILCLCASRLFDMLLKVDSSFAGACVIFAVLLILFCQYCAWKKTTFFKIIFIFHGCCCRVNFFFVGR